MQTVTDHDSARLRKILRFLKSYALFSPLVVVVLVRGLSVGVGTAVHSIAGGCIVAFFALLIAGISQLTTSQQKEAYSSFVFAGVAMIWVLITMLLPPLPG